MRLMKLMGVGSLLLFMLVSAGCGEIRSDYTVNKDGSISIVNEVGVASSAKNMFPGVKQALDEEAENGRKLGYDVNRTDTGLTQKKRFTTINDAVKSGINLLNGDENHGGVRVKRGYLYDTYSFDLYMKGQTYEAPKSNIKFAVEPEFNRRDPYWGLKAREVNKVNNQLNSMVDNSVAVIVESMKAEFTLNLPYSADSNNADKVSNNDMTLTWDVKKAIVDGKDLEIKTQFRIYHTYNIIVAVAGLVVVIAVGITIIVLSYKKRERVNQWKIGIAVGALMIIGGIAGGLYTRYLIDNPPALTPADRVIAANAKDSSDNALSETMEKAKKQGLNSIDDASSVLRVKGVSANILATSKIDDDGFIALANTSDGMTIYGYNKKFDKVFNLVDVRKTTEENIFSSYGKLYPNKENNYHSVVIGLVVNDADKNNADAKYGEWRGTTQILPIYMTYSQNEKKEFVIHRYYTGPGLKPYRYDYIQDERNKALSNTVFFHLESLKLDMINRGMNTSTPEL